MNNWQYFFFSSRRRHTRSDRDWSSDVCSSDLTPPSPRTALVHFVTAIRSRHVLETVVSRYIGEGLVGAEGFAVDTCAYRKSSPSILVVQSTQDRTGQN